MTKGPSAGRAKNQPPMPIEYKDRVLEFSHTTGIGSLTLAGTSNGFQTALAAFGAGDHESHWVCAHPTNGQWEVFRGTVNGTTLTRAEVLASSNAGALVDFAAGRKEVRCTLPAEVAETLQAMTGMILADGSVPWTANQSVGGFKLTDVADPAAAQDAATKAYVDAVGATAIAGSGDVDGPASSTEGDLAIFADATGKLLKVGALWRLATTGKMKCGPSYTPTVVVADAATMTFNWNLSNRFQATLGGNRTFVFSNVTIDQPIKLRIYWNGFTATWPAGIYWPGGVVPTPTPTAGRWDNYVFECLGLDSYGNPLYEGYVAGQNFGA